MSNKHNIEVGQRLYGIGFGNERVRNRSLRDQPITTVEVTKIGRTHAEIAIVFGDGTLHSRREKMKMADLTIPSFNGHFQMFRSLEERQAFVEIEYKRAKCAKVTTQSMSQWQNRLSIENVEKLYLCLTEIGLITDDMKVEP